MENLKYFFDVVRVNDNIVALKRKDANDCIVDMLGGINQKHFKGIVNSEDPLQYVKENMPHCIDSERYDMLQIYIYLEDFNKVFQYYNMNENVFSWNFQKVRQLAKHPPNLIDTICDEDYPDIHAVVSFFPDVPDSDFTNNHDLDSIYTVRKYITTEDVNMLDMALNRDDVMSIFSELVGKGLMRKVAENRFVATRKAHAKGGGRTKKHKVDLSVDSVLMFLKTIFPSFETMQEKYRHVEQLKQMENDFGICKTPNTIAFEDVGSDVLERSTNPETVFVVFKRAMDYDFPCYRFGSDSFDNKMRSLKPSTRICLVLSGKYMFLKLQKEEHPYFSKISKLDAIYHTIRLQNKHIKSFKFSKLIIYKK